ncbi:MAG: tetratricopeptide repeat protein [Myxococcota bacterium]
MDQALQTLLAQGREAYQAGELDRAEPLLREASGKGAFADVQNMLGVIYHRRGRYEAAQGCFEEALRMNAAYTDAALNLAVTYNELGKYDEAKRVYEQALGRAKDSPHHLDSFARGKIANLHAAVGDAYLSVSMLEEASREYRLALDLSPSFADLRTRLASTYRDMGRLEDAVVEFDRVRKQNPNYVPARLHLGLTLYALDKKDEAAREWQEVLKIDPENRSARTYLHMVRAATPPPMPRR